MAIHCIPYWYCQHGVLKRFIQMRLPYKHRAYWKTIYIQTLIICSHVTFWNAFENENTLLFRTSRYTNQIVSRSVSEILLRWKQKTKVIIECRKKCVASCRDTSTILTFTIIIQTKRVTFFSLLLTIYCPWDTTESKMCFIQIPIKIPYLFH